MNESAEEQIRRQLAEDSQQDAQEERKLTVVVYRRRESDPFEARVLQQHQLGLNLSPRTGTAEMAKSAAERRLRLDGWRGVIVFEEGFPESVKSLPVDTEPVSNRRGLRTPRKSQNADLF